MIMDFNEYQEFTKTTAIYPDQKEIGGLVYTALGVTGESGEYAGKVKKILRDSNKVLTEDTRLKLIDELGDILYYVAANATELNISLAEVATLNKLKLEDRANRGVLCGSGDSR